jgi:phosphoribosyl 1,2-cyclic phosphodiesterase
MPVMSVRFWGVRGTIPSPGPTTLRYGGNTACVEVRCDGKLIILDGGSGLRWLGAALQAEAAPVDADAFYTHFHLDHLVGLPFFAPAYRPGNRFRLWAPKLMAGSTFELAIDQLMSAPLLPVRRDVLKADIELRNFLCGETLIPRPDIVVRTAPLNHPNGAAGYRIEYGGKVLAYVTDTEHHPGVLDRNVLDLADRADLMIYDATYTEAEYPAHVGWGHSTWEEGVRIANAAGVKVLALFHHDPAHDDDFLDAVGAEATAARPGTIVAREGAMMTL